jgi:hypothetical protein
MAGAADLDLDPLRQGQQIETLSLMNHPGWAYLGGNQARPGAAARAFLRAAALTVDT